MKTLPLDALYLTLASLLLASTAVAANAPTQSWGRQIGTPADDFTKAIVLDREGRCYVAGVTGGDLGGPSAGKKDVLIGAFDAGGQRLWLVQTGTAEDDGALSLALAPDGAIFVAGMTRGKFGATQFGASDVFLAKVETTGRILWVQQYGTEAEESNPAIACDAQGSVFITAATAGQLGEKQLGGGDAFLIKVDGEGHPVWTCQWGTSNPDQGSGVAIDREGNLYVTGATQGTMEGCTSAGALDLFLSKIDPAGHLLWNRQFGTPAPDIGMSILIDPTTNIFIGGSSGGDFAGTQAGQGDSVLLKLSSVGELLWKRQFGTAGWDGIHGLAFTDDGAKNIAAGGCQAWDKCQAFVREFDQDGNEVWSTVVPSAQTICGTQIAIDAHGDIFQTGGTHGAAFSDYSGSGNDAIIVKFSAGK
jgi:hypothetical protein